MLVTVHVEVPQHGVKIKVPLAAMLLPPPPHDSEP